MIGRRTLFGAALGTAGLSLLGGSKSHEARNVPFTIELAWGKNRDVESVLADLAWSPTRLLIAVKDTPLGRYWGHAYIPANAVRAALCHPYGRIAANTTTKGQKETRKITIWKDSRFFYMSDDGCLGRLRLREIKGIIS